MLIFYDVDTQRDFMNKSGALYIPGAEEIKQVLKGMTATAAENNLPVLGSVDRHFGTLAYKQRELELSKYAGPFPDHCMKDTQGELKIPETTINLAGGFADEESDRTNGAGIYITHPLTNDFKTLDEVYALKGWANNLDLAVKSLTGLDARRPVYIEKQSYDVFTNPAIEFILKNAAVDTAIVYGVATDYCVKAAVLGMQKMKIDCYVIEDAIRGVFPESTMAALGEMTKAGAKLVKSDDLENILQKYDGGRK